jgi:hypothetical protein
MGQLEVDWKVFWGLGILGAGQRRGVHVNIPEIGSRVGVFCFGGILGFYAELRRELVWGNLKLGFFEVLGVSPRGFTEEGGDLCEKWGNFGGFTALWVGFVSSINTLRGDVWLLP